MVPRLLRLAAACLAVLGVLAPPAAAERPFGQRFGVNDEGDVALIGNALLGCPPATCADPAKPNNNDHLMVDLDVDGDPGTFNSSAASLALSPEARVRFAGLYWSARTTGNGGAAPRDVAARGRVKLKVPGAAAYRTVTATQLDGGADASYQGFADVTALVQAAGTGRYTVADVQAGLGTDRYASWALVVAYHDPAEPARNLSVFDGFDTIRNATGETSADITVSGFRTAPAGYPRRTRLGAVVYEGDRGLTGDTLELDGHTIADAANPATNAFNSTVSRLAVPQTTGRVPALDNHLGTDIDLFAANDVLPSGATSATVSVATGGETFYPGVLTFASELEAPKVRPVTTVTDLDGGAAEPGDVLEYEVTSTNTGNDEAVEATVRSPLPGGVELVPGSATVVLGAGVAAYDPAGRTINWRLGGDATADAGGTVAVGERVVVRYRVTVGAPANGSTLAAAQIADYRSQATGDRFRTAGTGGSLAVAGPDLAVALDRAAPLVRGAVVDHVATVRNTGAADTLGPVTVSVDLPAGLEPADEPSGAGWTCATTDRHLSCSRDDALAPGAAWPPIAFPARVARDATGTITTTVIAGGGSDGSPAGDVAAVSGVPSSSAALALALAADPATIAHTGTTTVTARVTNGGPSDADGVRVAFALPAGLELDPDAPAGACAGTTCTIGAVPAGASGTVALPVRATRAAAGTTLAVHASATADTPDATAGDDHASAPVTVRPGRDVAVAQAVAPDPPVAGEPVTLTLTVTNGGPSPAADVVLAEELPAALTAPRAEIDPAHGACAFVGGALRCELAPLAAGARVPVRVTGTVRPGAAGERFAGTAATSAVDEDRTRDDDRAPLERTVAARADLSLTAVDAPAALRAGQTGTWRFRAANAGPSDAADAVVRLPLPAGARPVDLPDGCATPEGEALVRCALGTLAAGAERPLALRLAVDPDAPAGDVRTSAELGASAPDAVPGDTTAEGTTAVTRAADLAVAQTHEPAEPVAGGPVAFLTTVANEGPSTATDVVLTQRVPAALGAPRAELRRGAGTCELTADTVTCRLPRLAPGERAELVLTGTVAPAAAGVALEPAARVAAAEPDPDPSDDRATDRAVPVAVADLSVSSFAPAHTLAAGEHARFALEAANAGPSEADDVVLSVRLPDAAEPLELDPRCRLDDRVVRCSMGRIAAGGRASVVVDVRASRAFPGRLLGASARVTSAARDLAPANDSLAPQAEPVACVSRRLFPIRLRVPPASTLRSVRVRVGGLRVPVHRGSRLTAIVDLRGRPAGRVVVEITATTRRGRRIAGTRAYLTCTPKRPTLRPPRI